MRLAHMLLGASFLMACSQSQQTSNSAENSAFDVCDSKLDIPHIPPSAKYEHWHLLVSKLGMKRWNGQDIDSDTARRYMLELSKMPNRAGNLVIHLEPDISCEAIDEVRRIINESPLCSNNRCFQDKWDYERPIVN